MPSFNPLSSVMKGFDVGGVVPTTTAWLQRGVGGGAARGDGVPRGNSAVAVRASSPAPVVTTATTAKPIAASSGGGTVFGASPVDDYNNSKPVGGGRGGRGGPSSNSIKATAMDATLALIGAVCLVVVLLALGTSVFSDSPPLFRMPAGDYDGGGGAGVGGQRSLSVIGPNSSSVAAQSIAAVAHRLFDGTVGAEALGNALLRRVRRAKQHKRRASGGRRMNPIVATGQSDIDDVNVTIPSHLFGPGATDLHESTDARPMYQGIDDEERGVFDDDSSFFVAVCQFRDVLCPLTLLELYGKARNPRRVFTGIVDQREKQTKGEWPVGYPVNVKTPVIFKGAGADETCVPWYMMKECATSEFCPTDNIRVRHSWPNVSKGPTWGRFMAGLMYQGEHYFMSIDSHSRFAAHWDMQIVLNLLMVPKTSKKAVLTHYPGGFQAAEQLVSQRTDLRTMMMCSAKFIASGIIRMNSRGFTFPGDPIMQPFSAGGFIVGDASFVFDVPFDPYLYYVFDGEEVLYAVRLWTKGWDLFTPKNNILFHNYARHGAPRYWDYKVKGTEGERSFGQARVKYLMKSLHKNSTNRIVPDEVAKKMGYDREEDAFGLGKERTLEEYYRFADVNTRYWNQSFDFCHNISIGSGYAKLRYNRKGAEVKN